MTNKTRFQNSGQLGINRPGRYGNFVLRCNQPFDYGNNVITLAIIIITKLIMSEQSFLLTCTSLVQVKLH